MASISEMRAQARIVIDPLLLKLREEIYGSGVAFGRYINEKLIPPSVIQDANFEDTADDLGYIKGITTLLSGGVIGNEQKELDFRGSVSVTTSGNRTFIVIPSGLGPHNHDERYYTETEVDLLLSAKANVSHTHTASQITDFDTEVENNPAVVLNTAKVSNAYHTGDVIGDTVLTIQDEAVELSNLNPAGAIAGQSIVWNGTAFVFDYASGSGVVGIHADTHNIGGIDPISLSGIGAASQVDLLAEVSNRIAAIAAHAALPATTTTLGHVIIGSGVTVTSGGVISVNALSDPTTTLGDILYRGVSGITRLPIGSATQFLQVIDSIPQWVTPSGITGEIDIHTDQSQNFLNITDLEFRNSAVTQSGNRVIVRPGFVVKQDTTTIYDRVQVLVFSSGFSTTSQNTNEILIQSTAGIALAEHENLVATTTVLGHVKGGSDVFIAGDGTLSQSGISVFDTNGNTVNGTKQIRLVRGTVSNSGNVAELTPAIRVENVSGVVLNQASIIYFGDGTTVTQSGLGRVVVTAGQASDFIIQSVTNGITDKAPSSDAVYDLFTGHIHDDRYYTESEVDSLLSGKSNVGHTHTASDITDFDTEVGNNPFVVANTAKVSNATHTGEVTGSGYLTITPGVVTAEKLNDMSALEGQVLMYSGGVWGPRNIGAVTIASGSVDGGLFTNRGVQIQVLRGTGALPYLAYGEFGWRNDTEALYIGIPGSGSRLINNAHQLRGYDLLITTPSSGQAIVWSVSNGRWENGIPSQATNADNLGGIPAANYVTNDAVVLARPATTSVIGHVIIGDNITVTSSGVISVRAQDVLNTTTSGDMSFWNGADAQRIAPGSQHRLLTWYDGVPQWRDMRPATITTIGGIIVGANLEVDVNGVLSAIQASGMQNPMTSTGDMIYRSTLLEAERLPIGSNGQVLTVVGGIPAWQTISVSGGSGGGGGGDGSDGVGGKLYLHANFY